MPKLCQALSGVTVRRAVQREYVRCSQTFLGPSCAGVPSSVRPLVVGSSSAAAGTAALAGCGSVHGPACSSEV